MYKTFKLWKENRNILKIKTELLKNQDLEKIVNQYSIIFYFLCLDRKERENPDKFSLLEQETKPNTPNI